MIGVSNLILPFLFSAVVAAIASASFYNTSNPDTFFSGFVIFFVLLFGGYLWFRNTSNSLKEKQQQRELDLQQSKNIAGLSPISPSIILKRGEVAYFEEYSTYSEVRVERRSQSVFLGKSQFGNKRSGIFYGGSASKSKPVDVVTEIDSGTLTLTNKRLYFDGNIRNKNIKLNSIMSIKIVENSFSKDQLEISVENRSKSLYFSVSQPLTFREMIQLVIYTN